MSTLQVILAHDEGQETFDRHRPIWEKLGLQMLVLCPEGAAIKTDHEQVAFGQRGHSGAESITRIKAMLKHLEQTGADAFIVQDYDSISLVEPQVPDMAIAGNLFEDKSGEFAGRYFIHPPLSFGLEWLKRFNVAAEAVPDGSEKGYWDRYLGLVADGIGPNSIVAYETAGFAMNTIRPDCFELCAAAVRNGARHIHGIKSAECLNVILENSR